MNSNRKYFTVMFVTTLLMLVGCSNDVKQIPAGYIGRVLTPTGWEQKMLEAGQVDLGTSNSNGTYNTLVLLESTSTTIKEQFMSAEMSPDKQDHRILTKKGTPLAVDVYIRGMIPDQDTERNSIFAQVTPIAGSIDKVSTISIQAIYEHFAMMDVRSKVRAIFAKYDDYQDVYAHYTDISNGIGTMIVTTFAENKVPLKLQNEQLGNVKPDETLWTAQNQAAAASSQVSAINALGDALRKNPGYLQYMKWEALKKIAETGSAKGTNTLIITDGQTDQIGSTAAAVRALQPNQVP
jgi:hypothetical protein